MKKWILLFVGLLIIAGFLFFYTTKQTPVYVSSSESVPEIEVATSTPLLFVGDIMLGRHVERLSIRAGDEVYPFKKIKEFLGKHITIANLEGPIPDIHKPTPSNGFSFSFPSSTPRLLKEGGITAVSLANNHMFDQGRSGYEQTKFALDADAISHFGGYSPTEDDYFETKLGTTTVIVYGITMIATGWDEAQAVTVTKKLRNEHPDAHLIVVIHWGNEYKTQNIYQETFAHTLIDNGVDTIIGAHPHVVQGIELYKGKPIFYSLGNFIFDQYWQDNLEDGYMVRMADMIDRLEYEIIPIRQERSVPSIAPDVKRDQILSDISQQSEEALRASIGKGVIKISK